MLAHAVRLASLRSGCTPRLQEAPKATKAGQIAIRPSLPLFRQLASRFSPSITAFYFGFTSRGSIGSNSGYAGFHSSSNAASARRKKMNLRRNRRLKGLSDDIEGNLMKDEQLRKSMVDQGLSGPDGKDELPPLLRKQIERDMKDPKMQEVFRSGPEGKQQILDHFKQMGTQIDRLQKIKDLENKVLAREKAIMRGEFQEEAENGLEDADDDFEPNSFIQQAIQQSQRSSHQEESHPSDYVENIYQSQARKHISHDGEVITQLPQLAHLPPQLRADKEKVSEIEDSLRKRAKLPDAGFAGSNRDVKMPTPRETVYEPSPTSDSANDFNIDDPDLPPWPTQEEISAADDYQIVDKIQGAPIKPEAVWSSSDIESAYRKTDDSEDDLSPFSQMLRVERLRRAHNQEQYREVMATSTLPPMPRFIRDWILTQFRLGLQVPDSVVERFCPKGMTAKEYLILEGLLPEEGETLSDEAKDLLADHEQPATTPNEVDTESEHLIPGSDCRSFREAVERKHLGCLHVLCDPAHGLTVNGETPLHIAAILENIPCAQAVLDQKLVNVNATATTRATALHMAALRGDMNMCKLLIQRGAKVNINDDDGLTPLHLAVAGGATTSVVNYLIDQKANLALGDNQGATALHIAADAGNVPMIRLLLAKGSAINDVTADRETPLFLACEQGHLDAAALLLANGADPNLNNNHGFYPLHAASKKGSLLLVQALLASKANAYVRDAGENTPLHIAALGSHYEICRHLIAAGCPISEVNAEGWTALLVAAQVGSIPIAKMLLEVGSSIEWRNDEGSNVLHIALSASQWDMIPFLLQAKADVNVGDANNVTPLLLALQFGRADIAQLLLDAGARINTLTTDHITPLHIAIEEGLFDMAQVLLDRGASPTQETLEGYQPIHIAAAAGSTEWVQKLLDLGANPNALTQAGLTPLKIAQESNNTELEKLLQKAGARELDIFTWMELQEEAKKKKAAAQ